MSKTLSEPFDIRMFHADDWGSYQRNIAPGQHTIEKKHTQAIERKHLSLRTWYSRLVRNMEINFQRPNPILLS